MEIILSIIIGFAAYAIAFRAGYRAGYGDALRIVADDLGIRRDGKVVR
jgi:hypothetical protein